jgi:hypothetical protein
MAGYKNKGVLPGLLRLIYEDAGSFDNSAVSVTKIAFCVDIHTEESKLGRMR